MAGETERSSWGWDRNDDGRISLGEKLADMFDGGGRNQRGESFEGGGGLSAVGNALGGPRSVGVYSDGNDVSDARPQILGGLSRAQMTPASVAGGLAGSMALGPLGGILGSLIGRQMMERARQSRDTQQNEPLMSAVNFADGGDVRPGFFGMLAGLGGEDSPGLFGGLGGLRDTFFGGRERGPDEDQLAALRDALEAGEISQDTYETMYARLLLDEGDDPAMGLLKLSEYVTAAGQPRAPTQLSTTISRGSGGSGTRAMGRLGAKPLA